MGLDLKCPRCGNMMTFKVGSATVQCKACGYAPIHDANAMRAAEPPPPPKTPIDLRNVPIISQQKPTRRQEIIFYEGMDALARGDRKAAQRAFKRAIDIDKAFIDPWLWLTSTTDDPVKQRHCLEWVLAHEPDNLRAIEAIALLDGRLTQEDLTYQPGEGPSSDAPAEAVAAQLTCPQCGGKLTFDVMRRMVICWNCNHQEAIQAGGKGKRAMLAEALLKRKYKPRPWAGAERTLACGNCGATVTLSQRTLTDRCTFCGSQRVLVGDNAQSFEEPDSIVPFKITEDEALEAVHKTINSGVRALTRFFRDPLSHDEIHGVYIPFWTFDATAEVPWSYPGTPDHGTDIMMMDDVLVIGVDTLDKKLVRKIQPFDLTQARKYDRRYLADWPAEIYQLDVDEASLHARQAISQKAKLRTEVSKPSSKPKQDGWGGFGQSNETVKLRVNPAHISGMTYRLVLLPVWVVLLHEEDGDVRRNLVNGQTGKVAVGGRLGGLL